jgi:hypothetical protein
VREGGDQAGDADDLVQSAHRGAHGVAGNEEEREAAQRQEHEQAGDEAAAQTRRAMRQPSMTWREVTHPSR